MEKTVIKNYQAQKKQIKDLHLFEAFLQCLTGF